MSNNLRQIAKDLRSFVKRCKDVHYSDSLLISFLITGLLTIAPKLHADVASEQQEITAQTYDAITDLRQSFMRARKENEKSLKGAQSELVQLLRQGDQVIKSPWSSYQFGTGFTNNDWGTTYRGRGGKYLEYYRRDNDLTKYVFDKDKHLYGATNLNIPRNQEPNSLTINPANVHEPYKPYVPEKLDNINVPKDPSYNPSIVSPNPINPSFVVNKATFLPTLVEMDRSGATHDIRRANNWINYSNAGINTTSNTNTVATYTPGSLHNSRWWWGSGVQSATGDVTGGTINMGSNYGYGYGSGWYWGYGHINYNDLEIGGIKYWGNDENTDSYNHNYWNVSRTITSGSGRTSDVVEQYFISQYMSANQNATYTDAYNAVHGNVYDDYSPSSSHIGYKINVPGLNATVPDNTPYSLAAINARNPVQVGIKDAPSVKNVTFNITDTLNNHGYTGLAVTSTSTTTTAIGNKYNISPSTNTPNVSGSNGILVTSGTLDNKTDGLNDYSRNIIRVSGLNNDGVLVTGGNFNDYETQYTVAGDGATDTGNNGISATGGKTKLYADYFNISGTHNNGIASSVSGNSNFIVKGANIDVNGSSNNGIIVAGGGGIKLEHDPYNPVASGGGVWRWNTINVNGNYNNGLYVAKGTSDIYATTINVNTGTNNTGILVGSEYGEDASITIGASSVNANNTNGSGSGIYLYAGDITFTTPNNGQTVNISGNGSDTLLVVDAAGGKATTTGTPLTASNTVTFNNTSAYANIAGTRFNTTGNSNTGILIKGGHAVYTYNPSTEGSNTTITGIWDMNMTGGDNNVAIKNNAYARTLKIENNISSTNPVNVTSFNNAGHIQMSGTNNIAFLNLGYVSNKGGSSLRLDDVALNGDRSSGAVFYTDKNKGQVDKSTVDTGVFYGTVKLQGAVGTNSTSAGSVGIYANTGQNAHYDGTVYGGLQNKAGTTPIPVDNAADLKVSELNFGLGKYANNSILVYASNGTGIEVGENNGTAYQSNKYVDPGTTTLTNVDSNKLPNDAITDGVTTDSQVLWGYVKKNGETSSNSIIGYATGDTSQIAHRYYNIGGVYGSHITFKKDINMVSKNGTALRTDDGAVIDAKAVRAGGYKSILAYANGIGSGNGTPSTVNINGNVTAADYNTLGYYYDSTNTDKTYNNYGAVALNGGKVNISGTAVSSRTIEEESQGNGGSAIRETGTTKNKFSELKFKDDESLIYGMAAYADGNGSEVTFNSGVSVIDGENGALYATNKGKINFQGDIINQNNLPETITTGGATGSALAGITGMTASASHTRMGKNNVTGSNDNDHRNTTPFYVYRNNNSDDASITFNGTTKIDMYDGILLTGNTYDPNPSVLGAGNSTNREWDYAKEAWKTSADANEQNIYAHAKYKNTDKVSVKIMEGDVNIGLVNQYKDALKWNKNTIYNNDILTGIGTYAGGMTISTANDLKAANISLINDKLDIDTDVNVEDVVNTRTPAGTEDGFNSLKMESTMVTVNANKTIKGDAANRDLTDATGGTNYQVRNAGLSMANTLHRWDDVQSKDNPLWRKTKNTESGFINKGKIEITGGQKDNAVTALNVSYGTIQNEKEIKVDHGNGMVGTDNSILTVTKDGEITVSGKYTNPGNLTSNSTNSKNSTETTPSGANYGIVGISRYDTRGHYENSYNIDGQTVQTDAIAISSDGKIKVDGGESVNGAVTATGIFAKNVNANQGNVTINYADDQIKTAGIEVQASGSPTSSRGVGIALVNANPNGNGGIITLKGYEGKLGTGSSTDNNIVTKENGIGIYGENADIILKSDKFTITTKDDGVGIWVTDNAKIAENANHTKTFEYNYDGKNNKNGFAMAFGGRNTGITHASNDLDIKFSNHAENPVNLAYEQAKSKVAAVDGGTYKGIAGILVNTNDAGDTVINRGNIEEDKSKTNVRAYGAVVNKGTFINYGKIKLNDSLDAQADQITSEDIKKANVGIFANSTNGLQTTIENHGDITIGDSTNNKNIGSWAIYGYNVNTGAKEDGSNSKITVNRNNYGIYSGDGNVNIQSTKLLVGNDTVLGHVKTTSGVSTASGAYPINRQTAYANANDLLSKLDTPRERNSAIGVYIDKGASNTPRTINVSADMDIDRFSYGIVMAEKNGGARTNVEIGSPTYAPTIVLASNKNTGGQVKSTAPSNPKVPEETKEQGNSVYYYSADTESRGKSYANVSMNGDYNTAYYTKGSMDNYGTIDLRSKYDVDNNNTAKGYGNVGIFSANTNAPSTNYGTIITGMSDTVNMEYSAAMAAGRNHYKTDGTFDKTTEEGSIVNKGDIYVKEKEGIGMFATGHGSKAVNYGNIHLEGESAIGMYLDRGAIGENYGEIEGNAQSLKGVVAINGGYIKNYGKINVTGSGSYGIVTDGSRFIVDASGNPVEVLQSTDPRYTSSAAVTAGQTNGKGGTDLYGGTESSIEEGTSGNPKTTGVGTTITMPDIVPLTKISVDGIDTPIFNVETDAANPGDVANNITISSSIQTGGTRIIDLNAKNEWGNPVWPQRDKPQLSEVTSVGMYVDTSGVRYTNPIDGLQNLPKLGKVDLYFGPEATLYTNSKAIRIGDKVDEHGNVIKSNMLKPFNDALSKLPGGSKVNILSASLTWQVAAKLDANNQLSEIYMSKVPYHSFAYDNDTSLVNFTNNLDNIYEIAKQESAEKIIFNKLNSLGNGEGHILAQAFDQMRGHIYGGVQQRIKATSDVLGGEINGLRNDRNVSKDSNKFKAFGQRNEFKTDTAGMPDWYSNAGGVAFVHEDETVRLGQASGWSAGIVNNYYTFKDLSKSYENQAMAKVGVFKSIPLDGDGTFVLNVGGDGFFGRNDMKRRFWVVDQEFRAKSSYYTYGAGLNAGLEKSFVINDGFSIVPNVGIKAEYGRFSTIHEKGNMALKVKSDDYISVKPSAGIDFRYSQEVFKNSNLTASLGFTYENEIGKLYDVENEARIIGAWTDYFGIRGDKEDKRGNLKSDLKLGLDNGRFGFNVNTGYDTKGHNFRAGLGLKVLY